MGITPEQPASSRRALNPFAFPPETNSFFTLLVIAAVLWMLELGQLLTSSTGWIIFSPIRLVSLLFLLAGTLYLSHPLRIRYRQRLRELKPEDDPNFIAAIQKFSNESGLQQVPRLLTDGKPTSMSGQALGVMNNYSLRLGGGLRLLFRRESEVFGAIIRHELAHIVNRDVSRAYLTRSIWVAVLYLTLIPTLLLIVNFFMSIGERSVSDIQMVLLGLLKLAIIVPLITAIYSNLLRSREFYADWRAKAWGAGQALESILQRNLGRTTNRNRLLLPWRLHPDSKDRLNALQRPYQLFHIKPSLAFLVGLLPGLMIGGFLTQGDLFLQFVELLGLGLQSIFGEKLFDGQAGPILIGFLAMAGMGVPAILVSALISNSLGTAVQRDAIARLDSGQSAWVNYLGLWLPAILFAMGYQFGGLLSLSSILEILPRLFRSWEGILYLFLLLLVPVSVTAFTWLGFFYLGLFTRHIVGRHIGTSPPVLQMRILKTVLVVILTLLLVPTMLAQFTFERVATEMNTESLLYFTPIVSVAVLLGLVITGGLFLITWVIAAINARAQLRCPHCGQISKHRYAVGHCCEHCNKILSGWLYLDVE